MATTPYMNITLPDVSSTPGPVWASELNIGISTLDAHNHAAGQGIPVPVAGMNINADFPLNFFNLTGARTLRMTTQVANPALPADLGCLSNVNGNLVFNNNSGTPVQITAGAALNAASIGGIGGDYSTSTASMFYTSASKTFTLWQNSNVPAKLDLGDLILRNITTPTNSITLLVPSALGSSYQLTLGGALPGGKVFMGIDNSGNITYDNSFVSLTLSGALAFGSIAATDANRVIDAYTRSSGASVGVRGVAISASSSSFSTTSTTYVDVTNLTVTITTSGRPVQLALVSDSTTGSIGVDNLDSAGVTAKSNIKIKRDSTDIHICQLETQYVAVTGTFHQPTIFVPPGAISHVDIIGAGTYTYKVQTQVATGTNSYVLRVKVVAYEI